MLCVLLYSEERKSICKFSHNSVTVLIPFIKLNKTSVLYFPTIASLFSIKLDVAGQRSLPA